ncbi:beta-ketoacyl-ACP synthase II [Haliangium ochraceum]|uniref:3-oxoacyl-[acyl-carrier-protein] synthase 2 n=1 Tax=Haliangium ochraceum (strain DSM 14365 / JCM 11303 / SMP-2) TaxID=502025 RepID=D0LGA1_HALO1|nr:beta-ketoacyl-ACP synthase II [Haliangium ochraceum]ACY18126.1 3-oxoacyl-(acyl-carrier-protein) synthase 2 [Haliangium ochraceum DSM 14365]
MRRVVITGIGLVTPIGNDRESTWQGLLAGKNGAGPITHFDTSLFATKFGCEVKDWDPSNYIDKRQLRHLDLFLQYGVVAGLACMEDAGFADRKVPEDEAARWGVYVGAGLGGVITIENTYSKSMEKGPRHGFSPYFVTDLIINMAPGLLSIATGARGPNMSHVSACSTGAHSIGEAMRSIRHGYTDAMLAGGCEATISILGVGGFNAMRALSTRNDAPQEASRPFDKDRDGFVIAEGAGVVLLEDLEHAKARGARIYAEVAGYGATSDAFHVTQPAPEGAGAQECMRMALEDARMAPTDIGYINAHGTSTPFNDRNESLAIKAVFGDHAKRTPVSSTKSMTGHMLGAAGGVETAIAALAIDRGAIPPTINYTTPDPDCDLDYVPNTAREAKVDAVLSNSFGFGGTNAALVLRRYSGD